MAHRQGNGPATRTKRGGDTASSRPAGVIEQSAPPLIVGIGASAGGLEAFRAFFAGMAPDTGMAFVLVQHLAPDHKSMLADILGKITAMGVSEATDGQEVEPNAVYVIPPNATLTIEGGRLRVAVPAPPREHRRPIDTFFRSLAVDQGENAVCIVLSGTGSDGALGLGAIKESGGFTLAQAEFDHAAMSGMPHSAAATGQVDAILPVEAMPARLVEYQRHLAVAADRKGDDGVREDTAEHLAAITAVLRAKVGHDFSKYKETTLIRRIQRRMQVLTVETVPAYVGRLREDVQEPELLFRELLVGVTEFFRDAEAFEALQPSIKEILAGKEADDQVRIWVPGSATGEEAYSIAMMVREGMEQQNVAPKVQIFATDIDDSAIAVARAGRYRRMTELSPERIERWFAQDGDDYCPVKKIREMIVFSPHSVVKDPPFSKLDLISCRNLLIYMDPQLQDRVLRTFHYALKPNGILFLGPSEGIARLGKLFVVLDKRHRIFRRRDEEATIPELSFAATPPKARSTVVVAQPSAAGQESIARKARHALARHSPVWLVIDPQYEIVRFSGGEVGAYLEPSPGVASLNLFNILRKALRPAVRAAVQAAFATQEPVLQDDTPIRIDGKSRRIALIVEPIREEGGTRLCVVAFRESPVKADRTQGSADGAASDFHAVEQELHMTRAQLQSTIDDLESANEELKSATEEYQAVNEELQSSNEELETSKEEMQSINEELQTINAEMVAKNDLLNHLNSDLKNFLDSTQIATIFLDHDMRVKAFTPGMTDIFPLRDADRGRPITEIVTLLAYREFEDDVRRVMRELSIVEREVRLDDAGMTFIMRIRPYRSVDNMIDGVVVTFMDISQRKNAEVARRKSDDRYRVLFEAMDEGFCIIERVAGGPGDPIDFRYVAANPAFAIQSGVEGVVGKTIREAFPEEPQEWFDIYDAVLQTGEPIRFERDLASQRRALELFAFRIEDATTHQVAVIFSDITARKRAAERTALLLGELDHRVKNILNIVSAVVTQTLKTSPSPEAFAANIEGRVAAISRAHGLLTQAGGKDEASLRDLISTELAPYGRQRAGLSIAGPDIALTPKAGLALAMAIHELASNAAKYGALSQATGRLHVEWRINGAPLGETLHLTWKESGGPTVQAPTHAGFGTTLIERSLSHEFDAAVDREFLPSGLRCTIDIPLTAEVGQLRPFRAEAR